MSESERPDDPSAGEPAAAAEEPVASEPGVPDEPPGAAEPATADRLDDEPVAPAPAATAPRRLVRSSDDRVLAGVCGGLGEYLGVDAVLIRIAALVLIFAGGAGLILYVIGWIAMPEAPESAAGAGPPAARTSTPDERTTGAVVLGAILVLIGAFFLLDEAFPDFLSWNWIWPIALIAVGAVVILRARR